MKLLIIKLEKKTADENMYAKEDRLINSPAMKAKEKNRSEENDWAKNIPGMISRLLCIPKKVNADVTERKIFSVSMARKRRNPPKNFPTK